MRSTTLALALAVTASAVSGLKIPLQQSKREIQRRGAAVSVSRSSVSVSKGKTLAATSSTDNGFDVTSVHDLVYLANITIGGTQYPVQIDTGSSDLWVQGAVSPMPNTKTTSQSYNLTYGMGWAYGAVSYAPVEFAGISVPTQAFMDISSVDNPALSYGAMGIAGLGFTSLSNIDNLVNSTGASTGRSLLYNLFLDNPSEPNFIAFSLSRSTDPSDSSDGLFTVGEYDPKYQAVANADPIPTWPVASPSRWSVLVDSIVVGANQIDVTTVVADAPTNKAVALLDSGTSYSYAPPEVCQAIYGGVKGAQYDSAEGTWIVPCNAEIDMAIQIGDWLLGDNFLRSVYAVYDFGDFDGAGNMGNPYLKLMTLVDPDAASKAFHQVRGGTAATNITYNAANSTTSPVTVSLSDDVAKVLTQLGTYFPVMLGVIALNSVLLLILIIVGIIYLVKRRGPRARKQRGRTSPVPLNRTNSRFSSGANSQHVYEPVSMALTEDTFVPPMPAFRGDKGKNRPKSAFSTMSSLGPGSPSTLVATEDEPFTPPTTSFSPGNVQPGDRPQSVIASSSRPRRPSYLPPARATSSYTPNANSPNGVQFNAPPTFVTSPPEENHELEEPPLSPAPPSLSGSIDPPSPRRSMGPPSPTGSMGPPSPGGLGVPRSPHTPSFTSNVQPGDRPRSYFPPAPPSPEDEVFAVPAPAFMSGSRPRSMA
ncbi:hypothetical protein HWV62_41733 [Athelia sp. TMB]|nr:hypothetical protein HWV62_41733 [Athelia sp. TMB]